MASYETPTTGKDPMLLHHFFHVYADGKWQQPVAEHIDALEDGGLMVQLLTMHVGLVGQPGNVAAVHQYLANRGVTYGTCAVAETGYEQVTLDPLYQFARTTGGYVLYTHTKGASRDDKIDTPWRRSMEFYNVVDWTRPVAALDAGATIAGCHWIRGNPEIERLAEAWKNRELNPPGHDAVGGMFGGNFWWANLDAVRRNCPPSHESRFAAEHWLGQLSEVMPIIAPATICDLNPHPITREFLTVPWKPRTRPSS
jgi:hypothetical protein